MDIVSLSPPARRRKKQVRRHTTEVRLADLPSREVCEDDSKTYGESSSLKDVFTEGGFNTTWESFHVQATEGSEMDVLQEMKSQSTAADTPNHGYQLSYELALDNMLTPFVHGELSTSYVDHVITEIVSTEETYVGDLSSIVEGYISPLEGQIGILQIDVADINNLFGNMREIMDFNRSVLHSLKRCHGNRKEVGQCFLEKAEGFKMHYSRYCNHYPNSIKVLLKLQEDSSISNFIKMCQQHLNHMLPLGAYLLKPVQRVMKYSLLLGQLMKNMSVGDYGFTEVSFAVDKMTSVSKHINKMKEEYDADVHIRGIQDLIRGLEGAVDLTKAGGLVLEENLRYIGGRSTVPSLRSRADRNVYTFLFRKLMLMTKKDDDGYQYRTHLEIRDIQLTERVEKEAHSFQVRQVSTGNFHTLQAQTHKSKEKWVNTIKKLLMESIPGLPDKARMLIMAGFQTDFGDSMKKSPRSPRRQRHHSDKASPSPSHRKNASGSMQPSTNQSKAKSRSRSSTMPGLLTTQLVQASLVATLQLEPFQELSDEKHEGRAELQEACNPAENTSDEFRELQTLSFETSEKNASFTTEIAIPTSGKPVPVGILHESPNTTMSKGSEEVADQRVADVTSHNEESCHHSSDISQKQCLSCTLESGDLSVVQQAHLNSDKSIDTDSEKSSGLFSGLNHGDMQTLQVLLCGSQESVTETDLESAVTPPLPPPLEFTDDFKSIGNASIRSSSNENAEFNVNSSGTSTSEAKRRHSFSCEIQTRIALEKQENSSSGTKSTPTHERKSEGTDLNQQLSSVSKGPVSVAHSQSEQCLENCRFPKFEASIMMPINDGIDPVSRQDSERGKCNIEHFQSPPMVTGTNQHSSLRSEEVQDQNQPCNESTSSTPRYGNPFGGNPDEQLSFDEVLQHYDDYASFTGRTARSSHASQVSKSPNFPKREKRKKDRKRSMTIAGIDRTMLLAAAERNSSTPDSPKKAFSKVQNLAREYSRRIKDHQRSRPLPVATEKGPDPEPHYLDETLHQNSKERLTPPVQPICDTHIAAPFKTRSLATLHAEQTSMTVMQQFSSKHHSIPRQASMTAMEQFSCKRHPIPRSNSADFEPERSTTDEIQRNRGLKGLVKSLVVKFGGGK